MREQGIGRQRTVRARIPVASALLAAVPMAYAQTAPQAQAPAAIAQDPSQLLSYLVDRMLTGYEQDDDVTVLVVHVPSEGRRLTGRKGAGSARKGRA